jgi:tetratricopeptide (TPR) repeat protein
LKNQNPEYRFLKSGFVQNIVDCLRTQVGYIVNRKVFLERMRHFLIGILVFLFLQTGGVCSMPVKGTQQALAPLTESLSLLANGYQKKGQSPNEWKETAKKLAKLSPKVPRDLRFALHYHEAKALALSGQREKALALLQSSRKLPPLLPESLWLEIQLSYKEGDQKSNKRRWEIEEMLGKILPLSTWGRRRDMNLAEKQAREGKKLIRDRVNGILIPSSKKENLVRVAILYREMGFFEEAALAFREAIYEFCFQPPGFPEITSTSWISPETSEMWLQVAQGDALSGKKAWAIQAVLLAVVAAPENLSKATQILKNILTGNIERGQIKPVQSKLLEIVGLYRESNLHPLALKALDQAQLLTKQSLDQEIKKIETEWSQRIRQYVKGEGSDNIAFLFGQNVQETPALSLVPPRFSYGKL